MDNLVHIGNADISIKEYKGERVVTFKDIDMVHERPDGTARKRFNDNKKDFILGEDYFVRNSDEAKGGIWCNRSERNVSFYRAGLSNVGQVVHG